MIVKFTGVNERLFFWHNDENGVFGQTLNNVSHNSVTWGSYKLFFTKYRDQ